MKQLLKHWKKLLNTECVVLGIGDHKVYPIFRNGSGSLRIASDRKYVDSQIADCDNIEVLLRDPAERFISGFNNYCYRNSLNIHETLEMVEKGQLVDRHFSPQCVWLLHLYKHYKGKVTLRSFEHLERITTINERIETFKKDNVTPCKELVDMDRPLMQLVGQTLSIGTVIGECTNGMS